MTFEKGYEQNVLGLRGVVYFGIGLLLLIIITFALMWALQQVFHDRTAEERGPTPPLTLNDRERLPPEPRLQLAPGFGVDSAAGRVNLELAPPATEYLELKKQWEEVWKHGQKDPKTGIAAILPIDEAKQKFLEQNVKARSDEAAFHEVERSNLYPSDASSGRIASERRR